jgi:uncharacterized protein (DUF2252 family)
MASTLVAAKDLTPAERADRGRAARRDCPRSSHAEWKPPRNRPDPIALLEEQGSSRVPELLPIRRGRMSLSPFTFYRGAAYVMASDLARTPRTGLEVQLCGDAHLSNFGGFAAPDRRGVFDCNDFDETLPGPWEWDVKRLVASLVIAARELGFKSAVRRPIAVSAGAYYREVMRRFAAMRDLEVWYARLEEGAVFEAARQQLPADAVKRARRQAAKAHAKDSLRAFARLTHEVDGEVRIISDPPLIVPARELFGDHEAKEVMDAMERLLAEYRTTLPGEVRHLLEAYRFVDLARKVVGVGSVGTRAFIVLLLGRDEGDPLFLQVKEAQASVLEPFTAKSAFLNAGERVVAGQRLMQAAGDPMLGWLRATGVDGVDRDFYVRQLWDWKVSAEVERMDPKILDAYGRMCAWTLARAHARSGDRIAIAAYLGKRSIFDEAVATFAEAYADQNERDHEAFVATISDGRLEADPGL